MNTKRQDTFARIIGINDARNGDDKPLVFTDEDDALDFAERCNQNEEDERRAEAQPPGNQK